MTGCGRAFRYEEGELRCEDAGLVELAEIHGTPLYVYSSGHIAQRYGMFAGAFAGRSHTVCYAVKANSSLAILKLLAERGAGFDIVSGGELERVWRAAPEALRRVVFSGVGKQVWEIDAALAAGILLFNVEGEAELALLGERARLAGKRARFALRVNPDVFAETHPYISTGLREHKFGIDIGLARAIYRSAMDNPWLDAAGVSVHIGSQIRSVEPFGASLSRVLGLVAELKTDGHDIRYVDAGGGLGIEYGTAEFNAASKVREYADALEEMPRELHLLLEPGRFLVAQSGALLTRVLYVKRNGAKTFVVMDAGMNDLIRPSLYQAHHEIVPVCAPQTGTTSVVDVVGPVCESGDFFAHDRTMPAVAPGDLVAVLDAGAYGMSLASNYNTRGRAAEVLVEGASARIIRRRETMDDLLKAETV